MKHPSLSSLLALGFFLFGAFNLRAETIFEASFEEPVYKTGSRLPLGLGKIEYGRWGSEQKEGFSALIAEEKVLSGSQSLLLERIGTSDESVKPARVWAGFQPDDSGRARYTKPLSLSFAFLLQRKDGAEGEGKGVFTLVGASASELFAVEIDSDGSVVVRYRNSIDALGNVVADQWYFLDVIGADLEHPGARPLIKLYEAQGEERGKLVGTVEGTELPPNSVYSGFSLSNTLSDSRLFFDNFQAVISE